MNCRMVGIAADFKNFLEEHQKVVKKQEAKKVRIAGSTSKGVNFRSRKVFPGRAAQQTNMHRNGISGTDYFGGGEQDESTQGIVNGHQSLEFEN